MKIAIIPARAGSKGIPRKNLQQISGRSLVQIACELALLLGQFDRIILSTDFNQAEIDGVDFDKVEFDARPANFASSEATAFQLLQYLADKYEFGDADIICWLEPTSPLRKVESVASALDLVQSGAQSVVCCREEDAFIGRMTDRGHFNCITDPTVSNRQSRQPHYLITGVAFVGRMQWLASNGSFVGEESSIQLVDKVEGIDINDQVDLDVARAMVGR